MWCLLDFVACTRFGWFDCALGLLLTLLGCFGWIDFVVLGLVCLLKILVLVVRAVRCTYCEEADCLLVLAFVLVMVLSRGFLGLRCLFVLLGMGVLITTFRYSYVCNSFRY